MRKIKFYTETLYQTYIAIEGNDGRFDVETNRYELCKKPSDCGEDDFGDSKNSASKIKFSNFFGEMPNLAGAIIYRNIFDDGKTRI